MFQAQNPPIDPQVEWFIDGVADAQNDKPFAPDPNARPSHTSAYAQGYLSIKPGFPQALAALDRCRALERASIEIARPIRYEEDGNVLFNL